MATVKKCTQCHQDYKKRSKQAYWQFEASLFCSKKCKGIAQGFKIKKQPIKECVLCKTQYIKDSKQPISYWKKSKYCSQACYKVARIPDIFLPRYRGKENQKWRRDVLKRDNYICKINNSECVEKLEVHHILRYTEHPELANEINNGITLCVFHHPRKKSEEQHLEETFKKLIWQQ